MITKAVPIRTRIVISHAMKWGILLWIWWKVNRNWDNNMIKISQWRESNCRSNAGVWRKKEIQKSMTVKITVWNPSRKVNHLSKVVWDRKIITEFTRSLSSTRIRWPVLMMDIRVSKDNHIRRWAVLPEYVDQSLWWTLESPKTTTFADGLILIYDWNLTYVRWNKVTKRVINRVQRSKILSELKPVENISKNLKSFLEIGSVQKEVLPSHKLRHHTYE